MTQKKRSPSATKTKSKNQKASLPAALEKESEEAVEGLLAREEAVKLKPGQKLPLSATHEIVGPIQGGKTQVKRKRFTLA